MLEFDAGSRYNIAVFYWKACNNNTLINKTLEMQRCNDLYQNVELTIVRDGKVSFEMIDEFCKAVYDVMRDLQMIQTAEYWK